MKIIHLTYFIILVSVPFCQSQESATSGVDNSYYGIGISGSSEDAQTRTEFGIVLMGGSTDVDEALQWMIARSGGGDFVIIRASGSVGYNEYIFGLGKVNSVETLLLDSREKANATEVGKRLREAEAVFIAGGDQSNYVNFWSDTEVNRALTYLINEKKIPIGGTSAGCAVLSQYAFDAKQGSVTSSEALANPYSPLVSISKSFMNIPFLQNTIADQHYSQRGREGRHVAFMARLKKDFSVSNPKGIGVDEKTAVCIDAAGNAFVYGSSNAYFLHGKNIPEVCVDGQPLTWNLTEQAIEVSTIAGSKTGTPAFNLQSWPTQPTSIWSVEKGVLMKR